MDIRKKQKLGHISLFALTHFNTTAKVFAQVTPTVLPMSSKLLYHKVKINQTIFFSICQHMTLKAYSQSQKGPSASSRPEDPIDTNATLHLQT